MARYAEPVVVNHGVLYGASGCESWCVLLRQWLLIMVCIVDQVIVNHREVYFARCCE
jgi:hypothetical protein